MAAFLCHTPLTEGMHCFRSFVQSNAEEIWVSRMSFTQIESTISQNDRIRLVKPSGDALQRFGMEVLACCEWLYMF